MRNRLIMIFGVLLVLFALAYFGSPYLAARNLKEAAKSMDSDALESAVDFPAVRDSLKSQLNVALVRKMNDDPSMKSNPFAGLGMMMVPAIIDRMVDAFVTPDGIAAMVRGQRPSERTPDANSKIEYSYNWVNLDRFRLKTHDPVSNKDGPSLLFERRGLFLWKLIRVEITDLLNNVGAAPTAPSDPATPAPQPTFDSSPGAQPTPAAALLTTPDPSASDEKLESQWGALNEECRGGQHTSDDEICSARDRVETALQGRGWCWAYSDPDVIATDYRWHRCDVPRP